MNCPKCKAKLRQLVNVIVEADADCHNLSKTGMKSKTVVIKGVDWGRATWFCPNGDYTQRLDSKANKK